MQLDPLEDSLEGRGGERGFTQFMSSEAYLLKLYVGRKVFVFCAPGIKTTQAIPGIDIEPSAMSTLLII